MRFNASFAHSGLTQETPQLCILILKPIHSILAGLGIRPNFRDLALL
jgi:hypothetical protein